MALSDVIHIAIPSQPHREGSMVLNLAGTGSVIIDATPDIVEQPLSGISGTLDNQFNPLDQDVNIKTQDSSDLDAFGRLRTSDPFNTFDMQFNYDKQPLFFIESGTGGGGTTHIPNSSAVRLTTGGTTNGDGIIFQCKEYLRYQPGKSQLVIFTAILGAKTANVRKRVGIFDGDNGLFFEQDGSNLKTVRRTKTSGAVVDNVVNQSDWNLDTVDGTGPSCRILNEVNDNIFVIDYQWLGGGRIRFGFDFNGKITYVHEIEFANTDTVPFFVSANLPMRGEIFNTSTSSGTTTFDLTCLSISSEGGFNPLGIVGSVHSTALREVTTANDPLPIISIRPRTTFNSITNRTVVSPLSYSIMSEDATIRYEIILNGTLTGGSFSDINTSDSVMMVDVAGTGITGGLVIDSGFVSGGKDKTESGREGAMLLSKLVLSNNIAGTETDILTMAISIINSAGTASDCGGSFTWKELR